MQAGADIDARSDNGASALHDAIRFRQSEVIPLLLAAQPYPENYDKEGLHPLALAASLGVVLAFALGQGLALPVALPTLVDLHAVWAWMGWGAVLSSLAFGLWTILLKYNSVGLVTVFNFLVPIFGAILSAMFLGETVLEWKNLVALAFVCAGIWLVTKEPRPALPQACPKPC